MIPNSENIPLRLESMDIINCKVKWSMGVFTSKRMTKLFGGMMEVANGGLDMIVKKDQICVLGILSMMSYAHTRLQNGMEN